MTGVVRQLAAGAIAAGILAGSAGCAKDSTSVYTIVDADATVPWVLILRLIIAPVANPSQQVSSELSSPNASDAADRPGPFVFPIGFPLTVDASLAGQVTITIEGIDWDTHGVIASATTPALVVAQKQTVATLTLTAVAGGMRDGGTDAGADAAP